MDGKDAEDEFTRCKACAFWQGVGDNGHCHRNAPGVDVRPLQVSRWPETRANDGCGEGLATDTPPHAPPEPRCGLCCFWRRPQNGIDPGSRGDHSGAWWSEAGVCRRYSPRPQSELGSRAFWRVTHRADFCVGDFRRQQHRLGPSHAVPADHDEPLPPPR